jgi:hypothetical protein
MRIFDVITGQPDKETKQALQPLNRVTEKYAGY